MPDADSSKRLPNDAARLEGLADPEADPADIAFEGIESQGTRKPIVKRRRRWQAVIASRGQLKRVSIDTRNDHGARRLDEPIRIGYLPVVTDGAGERPAVGVELLAKEIGARRI